MALEEEYDGFKFRVLFNRYGYTPHYAEHFVERGSEKLLMADPHMRRSVIIYNVTKDEVEWEYAVEGDLIPANPHVVRILPEDVPEIGASSGSIMFADRYNAWSFVELRSGNIECKITVPDVKWAHDIVLSKNRDGFIITDYSAQFVGKIDFKGKMIWRHNDFGPVAKLSVVEGKTSSGVHSNSFGGDYLAVRNSLPYGVFEIKDEDGSIVQSIPRGRGTLNDFWCHAPHSAFRKGVAEGGGNLTVVGFEAGGGIVALDQWQRPRWGLMKGFTDVGGSGYIPSHYGLAETTHVFPTVGGGVGAVDWSGTYSSRVIEILRWPRSNLSFLLAWEYDPGEGNYLDPPIDIMEYNEVSIAVMNTGNAAVTGTIYETALPTIFNSDSKGWSAMPTVLDVAAGRTMRLELQTRGRSFIRLFLRRAEARKPTTVNVVVSYR
ncbi:MAG TPA: hypothetical protein VEG61_01730 [Candidatus Dormibacteraeota bacterium]|jgi:hypothetical protein|nr:hypothetical protein [Candidatus Dormibacteraeota bacterium]